MSIEERAPPLTRDQKPALQYVQCCRLRGQSPRRQDCRPQTKLDFLESVSRHGAEPASVQDKVPKSAHPPAQRSLLTHLLPGAWDAGLRLQDFPPGRRRCTPENKSSDQISVRLERPGSTDTTYSVADG